MLHLTFYILLDLNILIFLLFYLYCNIGYILLVFLLTVHMSRIFCHSRFLVLVSQRSSPLGSYLGNFTFLTLIGLSLLFLVLMYIVLFDKPILGLNEISSYHCSCLLFLLLCLRLLVLVLALVVLIFHNL